jgi:hypothetical protein
LPLLFAYEAVEKIEKAPSQLFKLRWRRKTEWLLISSISPHNIMMEPIGLDLKNPRYRDKIKTAFLFNHEK